MSAAAALTRSRDHWWEYNVLHAGAVIAHALSYLTTLWFVQWLTPESDLRTAAVVAYVLEMFLFALKRSLRSKSSGAVGWTGVSADAVINMGGLLPWAPRIVTFPPFVVVAALVTYPLTSAGASFGWATAAFTLLPYGDGAIPVSIVGLLVALLGGMLLSAGPAILWEVAEGR